MSMMHLKSICLEQFRQYTNKTTIDGLDAGLCIIAGSNEAGKSTLLQALRAALFDRYKSSVGQQFRPYGAAVSPSVGITFEVDGVEYCLSKTFSKKKDGEAVLEFTADQGKQRKEGDEAEDYLAELLGFQFSKKGASKAELQGLAGLLWVEQSKAHEIVDLSDNSRRRVQSVFEHEMRDLLGGESGDAIHQRISEMWGEYYGKNGPIGAYSKLFGRVESLSLDVDSKRSDLEAYESKVDQLEAKQKDLQTYHDDNSLAVSKKRLEGARAAVKQIEALRQAVEKAESEYRLSEPKFQLAENDYTGRTMAIEELRASAETAQSLEARVTEVDQLMSSAEEEAQTLSETLDSLKKSQLGKSESLILAGQIDELSQLSKDKTDGESRLKDAKAIDKLRREAVANRDKISLDEGDIEELKNIRHKADLALAKLEAAATRFNYDLESGVPVELNGNPLDGEGSVLLSQPVNLHITGVGSFTINPGGDELEVHKVAVSDGESQLKQKLLEFSVGSLQEAEGKWREKQAYSETADRHEATLAGMAPDGLSTIEDQISIVSAKIEELEGRLGDKQALKLDADTLLTEISELKAQIVVQEEAIKEHAPRLKELRGESADIRADKKAAMRHSEHCEKALEQARKQSTDDHLLTCYASAKADVKNALTLLEKATEALDANSPEVVDSALERAERVAEDIEQEIDDLKRDVSDLKVELSALGQKGLSEELAEAEGHLTMAQLEFDIAHKRARALDLLKRTLDESLKSAKEVAAKPITEKLIPYLKQLIPEANPLVDENMVLVGIEREGTREPFEDLSIGTREQLAVLIRLAYADLLSESNQPVIVILDDALVNSDDERRDRMKAILYQASKRYQVIVLTCHGREYRDSGGQFIRLEERTGLVIE